MELQYFWPIFAFLLGLILVAALVGLVVWYRKRFFPGPFQDWGFQNVFDTPSQFIKIDDFNIHYLQKGNGPDILMLHGIGASIYSWRKIFNELTKTNRVTILDLPGFGLSDKIVAKDYDLDSQATRIVSFCRQLRINNAMLVGCSMGGTLSLWLALKYPENFSSVVALAPAVRPRRWLNLVSKLGWSSKYTHRHLGPKSMNLIVKHFLRPSQRASDDDLKAYLYPYQQSPDAIQTFLRATKILSDPRIPRCFKNMPTRTLILHGDRDPLVDRFQLENLCALISDCELKSNSNGGHHVMEDEPDWVVQEIRNFQK